MWLSKNHKQDHKNKQTTFCEHLQQFVMCVKVCIVSTIPTTLVSIIVSKVIRSF